MTIKLRNRKTREITEYKNICYFQDEEDFYVLDNLILSKKEYQLVGISD